ncbi:MAG: hypothetical protein RLZZ76_765, partial [Candidatus Parcubacteria bacterium]
MLTILKNAIILIALCATIALGYFLYIRPTSNDDSNATLQFEITYKANRFVQRLAELKQIELNSDILSDSRFSSLTLFSAPVQSEPVGRE